MGGSPAASRPAPYVIPERFTSPGADGRARVRHVFHGRNAPKPGEAPGEEPPAAAGRVLSFFYRNARTGRAPAIALQLLEGYMPGGRAM